MGLRGPQPKGYDVELRTTVSAEMETALNQLVELTGVSKAFLVRRALLDFLGTAGVVYPGLAETLAVTPTAGPTRVRRAQMKETEQ
jgi:hypothetical protein